MPKIFEGLHRVLLTHTESDRKLVIASFENSLKSLKEKNAKKQLKSHSRSSEISPLPLDHETLVEKITITVLNSILDVCKDSEANAHFERFHISGKISI